MGYSWRAFGSTYHTAAIWHDCDRCNYRIEPGGVYERFVERPRRVILVWKYHSNPDCPVPPGKENEDSNSIEFTNVNDDFVDSKDDDSVERAA